MRTEPKEDPAASAGRRLEELSRLWAADELASPPEPLPEPLSEPLSEPAPATAPPHGSGRHAVGRAARSVPGYASLLRVVPRHLLLIVVAGAVFVLIAIWWTARGAAEPMPVADTTPAAASVPATTASPSTSSTATASPVATSSSASPVVVVDVAGKVRRPLVVTLPAGSRVIDAIRKAGGPRPGVDLSSLNLARVLVDGEQILVGARARPAVAAPSAAAASGDSPPAAGDARTNLNSATAAQLEELPGIGPVTAQKIVDWRTENGAFSSADELLEVDGIGPKTLAEIAPQVTW